jgi:hypothetical protein
VKTKGKTAWLVTWEGPEAEYIGRCKVVAVLPPQLGEKSVKLLLPFLYCSEHNYTLCEKMSFCVPTKKDPLFRQYYRDVNPELLYGLPPKIYLCARKVKGLLCEESKKDCLESTLYWMELPKFIPNPKFDPNGPMPENLADLTKQCVGEREAQYIYSIRPRIEEEKRRQAGKIHTGKFSIKLCA